MIGQKLRNWVVGIVTGVWTINFAASLIPQLKYHSDPTIHAVFMAIVGGVIALGATKKRDDDDHKDDAK